MVLQPLAGEGQETYRCSNQNTVHPRGWREKERRNGAQRPRRLGKQQTNAPDEPDLYERPVVLHCARIAESVHSKHSIAETQLRQKLTEVVASLPQTPVVGYLAATHTVVQLVHLPGAAVLQGARQTSGGAR